jgi:probable rRNA maturation factor
MFEIEIQNEAGYAVDEARLVQAATTVLEQHGSSAAAMTVVITDNDEVQALNRQYRGVDTPTDVLSFPAEAPPVTLPDEPAYLGDLVIAYPYASTQAQREGHGLSDSLVLLVAHGTLHLLGYDHGDGESRAAMWQAQEQALRVLGVPLEIVPALEGKLHDEPED